MRIQWKGWLLFSAMLANSVLLTPQSRKRFIPPPLRVYAPLERVWSEMQAVLEKQGSGIARESRSRGHLVTEFREYSSGPLTERHIAKIGEKKKLLDGEWVRVKYKLEILVEFIQERETLITVNANIKALKREFLGSESWVDIPTNGRLEENFLTEFGQSLFGQNFTLPEPEKGFWDRAPVYVPDPEEQIPKIVGPEKPPS